MSKKMARVAILATGLVFGAISLVEARNDVARQVEQLDATLLAAMASHDVATVDRMLLDEFVLVTSGGHVRSKQDIIEEIGSPDLTLDANASREIRVRVRGDTAVLTGVLHQKGVQHGRPFDATVRYTDTWVRIDGEWRQLSGHASRYPATE